MPKRKLPPGAPPRPSTPRGIEPVLRRGPRREWTWRYAVRWKDPITGKRKAEEFDTVGEAEDFRAHLRLARRRGALEDLTRGERTLINFVENEWWPNYAAKELDRNTLLTYAPVWNKHLHPRIGHLQLRQITPPVVQRLKTSMEDHGIGKPTIRRALAILQSICRHAITCGEMTINPVREVRKPVVTRQLAVVAIGPDQVETLRTVLLDGFTETIERVDKRTGRTVVKTRWHPPDVVSAQLVSLIAYEGLRPEEALGLGDDHIGRATLLIERKNIDGRLVAGQKTGRRRARSFRSPELFGPVRQDLAELRLAQRRPASCTLLFPRPDGDPWRKHDYDNWRNRTFRPAVKQVGLPLSRPYDLRHACASLLLHAGWPLNRIADHLGHSVATLSEFYAHLIADLRDAEPTPVEQQILAARSKRTKEAM
jgi:integrase